MSSATSGDMSQRQTYSTWQEFGELSGKHRLWQQVAEFERAEEARTWISAVMSDDQVPDVLGSSADVRADLSAITDAGASVGQLSSYPTMTAHDAAVHQRTLDSEERRPRSEDFSTAHVIHAISARTSGRSSERAGGVHALKCRRIAHDEAPRHLLERAASGRKNRRRGSADHHAPPTPNAVRPASPRYLCLAPCRHQPPRGQSLGGCERPASSPCVFNVRISLDHQGQCKSLHSSIPSRLAAALQDDPFSPPQVQSPQRAPHCSASRKPPAGGAGTTGSSELVRAYLVIVACLPLARLTLNCCRISPPASDGFGGNVPSRQ